MAVHGCCSVLRVKLLLELSASLQSGHIESSAGLPNMAATVDIRACVSTECYRCEVAMYWMKSKTDAGNFWPLQRQSPRPL